MSLRAVVSRIRDLFRSTSITNMGSVKTIVIFLLSKIFNEDMCRKHDVPLRFSHEEIVRLLDFNDQEHRIQAMRIIFNPGKECLLTYLDKIFQTQDFNFEVDLSTTFDKIIKMIDELDLHRESIDLIGGVYEEHLASGSSDPRHLGQFFSDRRVVKYMVNLVNLKPTDKIVDPTCGTGGFLTIAYKDLINRFPGVVPDVNGYEIEDFVSVLAKINLFHESNGLILDKINLNNILFRGLNEMYDVFLCNIPFGLKMKDQSRFLDYLTQFGKPDIQTEHLFLRIIMGYLKEMGRSAAIFPDSVLFRSTKYSVNTRKDLICNFEVKKVVKLNGTFFTNTSIKPVILLFERSGQSTQTVEYCTFDGEGEKKIGEISGMEISQNKNWSLQLMDYRQEDPRAGIISELWTTLGEICNFQKGTFKSGDKIKPGDATRAGKYPFYSATFNEPAGTHENFSFDFNESIVFVMSGGGNDKKEDSKWGMGKAFYVKGPLAATGDTTVLILKFTEFSTKFLYHYLSVQKKHLENLGKGSISLKHISQVDLKSFPVPVYPISWQMEIVKQLDDIDQQIKEKQERINFLSTYTQKHGLEVLRSIV